jgi:hypothetical protein
MEPTDCEWCVKRNLQESLRRLTGFRSSIRPRKNRIARTEVDQTPITTAESLAALAVTHHEPEFVEHAFELADQEVDIGFRLALLHAADRPATPSAELRSKGNALRRVWAKNSPKGLPS